MSLTPGTRVGPYEILACLGAGGMGEVFRARDPRLGRDVAIKVLHGGVADDPDRRRRFETEARAVAALNHPNVLTIYDGRPEVGGRDVRPIERQDLTGATGLRRHRAFFPAMSLLLIVLVFLGFAPTYYMRPASAGAIAPYLHVHGAAVTAWFLLLVLQTALIATRRRSVHRRLGIAGAGIATVIVALNPLVVAWSVAHQVPRQTIELTALIVVGDLLLMAIFAVFVALAIRWRSYPETHSRMLMLASMAVAGTRTWTFLDHYDRNAARW